MVQQTKEAGRAGQGRGGVSQVADLLHGKSLKDLKRGKLVNFEQKKDHVWSVEDWLQEENLEIKK